MRRHLIPRALAAGASCTVKVTFQPSSAGQKNGTFTVNSDDPDTPSAAVSILGTGTVTLPTVTTASITGITSSTAFGGGNVTSDGGTAVTVRGVCWGEAVNPTIADSHSSDGTGTGGFTSIIAGLTPNTPYHVRAYATNSAGTAYGDDIPFTSLGLYSITTQVSPPNGGVHRSQSVRRNLR